MRRQSFTVVGSAILDMLQLEEEVPQEGNDQCQAIVRYREMSNAKKSNEK